MDDSVINEAWRVFGWIIRLYKHLWQRNDRFLARYGLSSRRYGALMFAHQMGPTTNSELAKIMSVHPSTMTRIVDSLARKELVTRHGRDTHGDRREGLITITAEGKKLLDSVDTARQHSFLGSCLVSVFESQLEREAFISKLSELSSEVTGREASQQYEELVSAFVESKHPFKTLK